MKKILCPVDFSNASRNGLEFAGNLAAEWMAHLTLMYVRPTIWPEAVQLRKESADSAASITDDLKLSSDQIEKEFGVTCGLHLERTLDSVEHSIAEYGKGYDLIVTGTNGADDTFQLVFGSHSYQVIRQAMCPVLLIPEGVTYKPMRELVYAYDPDTNPIFLIDQLREFAAALNASVKVVHVVEGEKSPAAEARMEHLGQTVMARAPKNIPWTFEALYGKDVAWTLEHFAAQNKVDAMALSYHHRTLMDNLMRENVIKRISMTAEFPVFTFWR